MYDDFIGIHVSKRFIINNYWLLLIQLLIRSELLEKNDLKYNYKVNVIDSLLVKQFPHRI